MGGLIPVSELVNTEYCISYKNKQEIIAVSTPNKDDTKELFTWAAQQVGMIAP